MLARPYSVHSTETRQTDSQESKLLDGLAQPLQGLRVDFGVLLLKGQLHDLLGHVVEGHALGN